MLGGTHQIVPIPWVQTKGPVVNELIDTTEMYLRTIYELEEEGVVPLRARIAERLGQSGPTVSQTVARMERDGLVVVGGDRHLELTAVGRGRAVAAPDSRRVGPGRRPARSRQKSDPKANSRHPAPRRPRGGS